MFGLTGCTKSNDKEAIVPSGTTKDDDGKIEVKSVSLFEKMSVDISEVKLIDYESSDQTDKELTLEDLALMKSLGVKVAFDNEKTSYEIPEDISLARLKQATIIDFNGAPLYEIPQWLKTFKNLKKLDLSGSYASFDSLVNIPFAPDLEILILSNNRFFMIEKDDEGNYNFDVTRKKYSTEKHANVWISFLKKTQNVKVLDLSNTEGDKLKFIPANLQFLSELMSLNLSGNYLVNISESGLKDLSNLETLNLSNCGINDKDVLAYLPIKILRDLNLSNNSLSELTFQGGMPWLEVLDLGNNEDSLKIDEKFDGVFHTKSLRKLNVDESVVIPQKLQERLNSSFAEGTTLESDSLEDATETISSDLEKEQDSSSLYTDENLNVVWMRCSIGQKWDGETCLGFPQQFSWEEAHQLIQELNKEKYLGYDNWRLPHVEELSSLRQCDEWEKTREIPTRDRDGITKKIKRWCTSEQLAINTQIFPKTEKDFYWSSTLLENNSSKVWGVHFGFGNTNYRDRDEGHYVRLVH